MTMGMTMRNELTYRLSVVYSLVNATQVVGREG